WRGSYDPIADSWTAISSVNAPAEGLFALWTGSEMIQWGGTQGLRGGRYNPETDSWTTISTAGAPPTGYSYTGVWSGSRMIVWGAQGDLVPGILNVGGQYDP